ncbi:hypothetical protein [Belnapia sp. F-4-1]|uniref:hypothetical protein n=1 Tax=Belnapia sp. F-4-1 TaxID=1545443 RepID=UPI001186402E|nr:hypothetical protein [Belnapia sp. F-4-1]
MDLSQPPVAAAIVAGAVSLAVGIVTVLANIVVTSIVAERKLRADKDLALAQKAWAEYESRRDIYLDVARLIDSLHESGKATDRPEFLRAIRKVWLIGPDDVIEAANALTAGIRTKEDADSLERKYRNLFNAMRRDIRRYHAMPPEGTNLGPESFPIEGAGV